jgi:hypothetical protein
MVEKQILLFKATGGRHPLVQLVVDLSPLRLYGLFETSVQVDDFMVRWQTQILGAAFTAGREGLDEDLEEDDDNLDNEFPLPDYVAALDFNALREAWATVGNGSESASKEWRRALPIILLTVKIKLSLYLFQPPNIYTHMYICDENCL